MTLALLAICCLLIGVAAGWWLPPHGRLPRFGRHAAPVRHILFPFTIYGVSRRALDAAIRLAQAENATLSPAYLTTVPLHVPVDAPMQRQYAEAMPILDSIEQRASRQGVLVDSRVTRGRSLRDALRNLLDEEQFDRVVVSAAGRGQSGFKGDDVAWLLEHVPEEVVILRPGPADARPDVGRRPPHDRSNAASVAVRHAVGTPGQ